jgi:uncharacterized protein CbrC (UPF0167 family)
MTFKYFDHPELFVGLRNIETICDTCKQNKICFNAEGFLGWDELTSICPECLESGKLINLDSFTCTGDIQNLVVQLKQIYPNLTEDEIQEMAKQKTIELEKSTPSLATWQDWSWPCADGDYCKFIGYGSKPFYKYLANDTSVEDFFKESFYDNEYYDDDLWSESVPDEIIKDYNDSNVYQRLFYVFKSLNSNKIITRWDCL